MASIRIQGRSYTHMPITDQYQKHRWCGRNCTQASLKIPKKPMLTYCSITDFNIVVSVLSMFILLIKAVLFIMHMWIPLVSLVINMIVAALWCVSVYGQAGPDYSDPEHPSKVAWYITKSCSYAEASGNKHNCNMAKGSFAASILML